MQYSAESLRTWHQLWRPFTDFQKLTYTTLSSTSFVWQCLVEPPTATANYNKHKNSKMTISYNSFPFISSELSKTIPSLPARPNSKVNYWYAHKSLHTISIQHVCGTWKSQTEFVFNMWKGFAQSRFKYMYASLETTEHCTDSFKVNVGFSTYA